MNFDLVKSISREARGIDDFLIEGFVAISVLSLWTTDEISLKGSCEKEEPRTNQLKGRLKVPR